MGARRLNLPVSVRDHVHGRDDAPITLIEYGDFEFIYCGIAHAVVTAVQREHDFIDRVAAECVSTLAPRWASRLAAFDVYMWDQCYAMERSLRTD